MNFVLKEEFKSENQKCTHDSMDAYQETVRTVLEAGSYKPNRTAVDTVSSFGRRIRVDLSTGFPLVTTKDMSGARWDSIVQEFLWYLSGDAHVRELQEETSIWDPWADENGRVETSYARFWRRFPIPESRVEGEAWPDATHDHVTAEGTFDQLSYVVDRLRESPESRRLVVSAWHPANAAASSLPPCPYTFVFSVQSGDLNLHLTQRSADLGVGVPFDVATHSLLLIAVADRVGLSPGTLTAALVDAHVYCGGGDRGQWYADNLDVVQSRVRAADGPAELRRVSDWIEENAPPESTTGRDHIPRLLEQLARTPYDSPTVEIDPVPLDELERSHISLHDYDHADPIRFAVAQ